jgi:hypothetical protein
VRLKVQNIAFPNMEYLSKRVAAAAGEGNSKLTGRARRAKKRIGTIGQNINLHKSIILGLLSNSFTSARFTREI